MPPWEVCLASRERAPTARLSTPAAAGASARRFACSTLILARRHARLMVRNPLEHGARAVLFALISIFFSVLYIGSHEETQDQVFPREFLQWWVSNTAPIFSVLPMLAMTLDRRTMLREMTDNAYSPGELLAALTALQAPATIIVIPRPS